MGAVTSAPVIAVDLGGTKIRAGVVDGGRVAHVHSSATPARLGAAAVLDAVAELVTRVFTTAASQGITPHALGVGSAGVIDPERGVVVSATDALPGWAGTDLVTQLRLRTRLPVRVVNDVHAHALGEARFGAASGTTDSMLVAVGTGIGAGLICHGRLVTGRKAAAGHIGHVPCALAAGLPCPCGTAGHLEAIASGPAVLAEYQRSGGRAAASTTHLLVAEAHDGDPLARAAFDTAGRALGSVLGGLANVFSPEVIILGGGLAGAGDLWWPHVQRAFAQELIPAVQSIQLQQAHLGGDAALIGAAGLWADADFDREEPR